MCDYENLTQEQEEYIKAECEAIDVDEMYDEMLDDCYGTVTIAGIDYTTPYALKEIDPTAYRCGKIDWLDGMDYVEIDDTYYLPDDVEDALEDYEDEQIEYEEED